MPMADQEPRTQNTSPRRASQSRFPVPKHSTINHLLKKAAQPLATRRPSK